MHDGDPFLRWHAGQADGGSAGARRERHLFPHRQAWLKDEEVEIRPEVYLTFVYPNQNVYLAITGEAFVSRDPACARHLWDRQRDAWLSGPDDPNLLAIRVELWRAEMWDGPANCAVADFQFAKARLFGIKANLGENDKVTVELF